MKTPSPVLGGVAACALFAASLFTTLPASAAEAQTDLERFDALQTTPMSDELAGELRAGYWWIYRGVVFAYSALYSCTKTGICAGVLTRQAAQWLLSRYPRGNYDPYGGGGGGSW